MNTFSSKTRLVWTLVAGLVTIMSGQTAIAQQPNPYLPHPPISQPQSQPVGGGDLLTQAKQTFLSSPNVQKGFSHLGTDFDVIEAPNDKKNAFSHVLGEETWVNPEAGTSENPLAGMDRLFSSRGYHRLPDFDVAVKPGVRKIVLYVAIKADGEAGDITSAARQEADGTWTMKVGKMATIRFKDLGQLRGPTYGIPYAVYAR